MLPPTVMADPISATTWPKAVVITAARANRASRATVHAVRHRPAPSVSAVRRMRGSTPWTAAREQAVEQQPHHHGGKREGGVDDGERGAAPPKRSRGEHKPYGDAEPAGEDGGDEADLEGEDRNAVHFAVAREQQGDGAPQSLP